MHLLNDLGCCVIHHVEKDFKIILPQIKLTNFKQRDRSLEQSTYSAINKQRDCDPASDRIYAIQYKDILLTRFQNTAV